METVLQVFFLSYHLHCLLLCNKLLQKLSDLENQWLVISHDPVGQWDSVGWTLPIPGGVFCAAFLCQELGWNSDIQDGLPPSIALSEFSSVAWVFTGQLIPRWGRELPESALPHSVGPHESQGPMLEPRSSSEDTASIFSTSWWPTFGACANDILSLSRTCAQLSNTVRGAIIPSPLERTTSLSRKGTCPVSYG